MALQKNFTTESGIDLANAYFRIDTFRGDRNSVRLGVGVYVDKQKRDTGKPAVGSLEFILPTPNTSGNMFADAYAWLKTQEAFAEAADA
jgi:hypothetical protein